MAPALKVKRLKKSTKPDSKAVAKLKPKWEKPRKSISAQSGLMTKIKNVNKRSFDPLKANRGVVLLKNIPHGFYEDEMRKYFGQFGLVTRVRLARSERTGRSKGFAYIEFKVPEVAQIAAETMNNYIMFKHMLKTVYIPPDKQTYNFFRKDVTFTTDGDGDTSFSSAKTKSIEKAIETINRVPTDEEHAKRLKHNQKVLQKQQKRYGVDLSNIMVSGNSSSSDAAPPADVKVKESKKKALAAKKAELKKEKKTVTKPVDNKIASKKDKKKVASTNGGESLLQGLLDKTYETDTSDEDFKIDHSFNQSVEDSDDESGQETFADVLAKKLAKKSTDSSFMETSDSDDDGVSDDEVDDGESEDDDDGDAEDNDDGVDDSSSYGNSSDFEFMGSDYESEDFSEMLNDNKVDVTMNARATLKRKIKDESSSLYSDVASSPPSEMNTTTKKMKQNPTKKKAVPSTAKANIPKLESPKIALKKKIQKPNRPEKLASNTTTSSSEPESRLPQTRQKKMKSAPQVESTSKLSTATANGKQKMKKTKQGLNPESTLSSSITDTTSSEPEIPKQKLNKKKAKLSAGIITDTTSSEPEIPKQKLNKKKAKLSAGIVAKTENVTVQVQKEKPAAVNLQSKSEKKKNKAGKVEQISVAAVPEVQKSKNKNQPAKDKQTNPKASASAQPAMQTLKKKIQPAKDEQINLIPKTSAQAKVQKPEKKNKRKAVVDVGSTSSTPEPVKIDKKNKKVKPVTSSWISEPGFTKKSVKANATTAKANSHKSPEKSSAWTTVSETDGEDRKKPKAKGISANLKTIVHKKKNGNAKPLNAKKIKQTPDELLQLLTSKDMKQKNPLKSKKKSK